MNKWPSDSVQDYVDVWWVEKAPKEVERGRLVWAYLPHIGQQPMVLVPEGRVEPTEHKSFNYSIQLSDINRPPAPPKIPVAAVPNFAGEERQVFQTKKRPALILCSGGHDIPRGLRTGGANRFHLTCLVAPYYGSDQSGKRVGYKPEFVERVRKAAWPQFIWDKLPFPSLTKESILRLDHLQPVSRKKTAIQTTEYCLSEEALALVDEWFDWLRTGSFSEDSLLMEIREELLGSK